MNYNLFIINICYESFDKLFAFAQYLSLYWAQNSCQPLFLFNCWAFHWLQYQSEDTFVHYILIDSLYCESFFIGKKVAFIRSFYFLLILSLSLPPFLPLSLSLSLYSCFSFVSHFYFLTFTVNITLIEIISFVTQFIFGVSLKKS